MSLSLVLVGAWSFQLSGILAVVPSSPVYVTAVRLVAAGVVCVAGTPLLLSAPSALEEVLAARSLPDTPCALPDRLCLLVQLLVHLGLFLLSSVLGYLRCSASPGAQYMLTDLRFLLGVGMHFTLGLRFPSVRCCV